jgi:photosystem II stability/assembly factor-like uncharacterized protein
MRSTPFRCRPSRAASVTALLLAASPALAGDGLWSPYGPGGGSIRDLLFTPGGSYAIAATREPAYAGSSEVYRRGGRGGAAWSFASRGIRGRVDGLAFYPGPSPRILAVTLEFPGDDATTVRVFATADEGRGWRQVFAETVPPTAPGSGPFGFWFGALTAVPRLPSGTDLYLSAGRRLLRSSDGGDSWQAVLERELVWGPVAFDPARPRELYTTVYSGEELENPVVGGHPVRSLDGGDHWVDLPTPEPDFATSSLPVVLGVVADPPELFALSDETLYKSTDRGESWASTHPSSLVGSLAVDPAHPERLFALIGIGTSQPRIDLSTDGGESWAEIEAPPASPYSLKVDPATRTLYAFQFQGDAFRTSAVGGEPWRPVADAGILAERTATYRQGPFPSQFFRGDGRVSLDAGRSWVPGAAPAFARRIEELAIDPADPRRRYALTGEGLFASPNGGPDWVARLPFSLACSYYRLYDPRACQLYSTGEERLLLTGDGCGLYATTDGGRHWQEGLPCQGDGDPGDRARVTRNPEAVVLPPLQPRTVFAQVRVFPIREGARPERRLYRSRDGGAAWSRVFPGAGSIAVSASDPRIAYLGGPRGTERSTDGGRSFARVGEPPCSVELCLKEMAVDPHHPDLLYATTSEGALRSTDAGRSWEPLLSGLPRFERADVECLGVDPTATGHLFADPVRGGTFEGTFPSLR